MFLWEAFLNVASVMEELRRNRDICKLQVHRIAVATPRKVSQKFRKVVQTPEARHLLERVLGMDDHENTQDLFPSLSLSSSSVFSLPFHVVLNAWASLLQQARVLGNCVIIHAQNSLQIKPIQQACGLECMGIAS